MKLPSKVRIGPHNLALNYMDKVGDDDDWGHYSHPTQSIDLSNALLPEGSKWAEILIHEILHCLADQADIFNGNEKEEERVVGIFAVGVAQVLKDNKTLIRAILKALA